VDRKLWDVLQTEVPLTERPFLEIGKTIGTSEAEVLRRVKAMKGEEGGGGGGIIRQISAIFDSRSLGYQTSLVAAKVTEEKIEEAAMIINLHPGVSHNYKRNHAFNLWYTLAVPPESKLGLEETVEILHRLSGAEATRMMPTIKVFKIGVKFDWPPEPMAPIGTVAFSPRQTAVGGGDATQWDTITPKNAVASVGAKADSIAHNAPQLEDEAKKFIRILQQDLPVVAEPFAVWAKQSGVTVESLLEAGRDFLRRKWIRRFSAVFKHRAAGISANAMGAWTVKPEDHETFGKTAAAFKAVSHCYLRQSYPDWPFNMFTMVHAPTTERCEEVLAAISRETGVTEYAALYSTKEYKKQRVRYFTGDVERWEQKAGRNNEI